MMKKIIVLFSVILLSAARITAQQDADNCKDHPMYPKRMSNYFISECKSNYTEAEFPIASGKSIKKEGNLTSVRYDANGESGQQKPSTLQIFKNYENATKNIGGMTMYQNTGEALACYKILKNGKETAWVKVECGGNDNNDFYIVTTVQLEEMKQDVTSADILQALNTEGHIALYINFETGKSEIKQESQQVIEQIRQTLSANPSLKISIEGHTDNAGNQASNQTLSENRAKSVMNALLASKIDKGRMTAKGWGQTKPIADNTSEEGKAKNRRVEIVKL
jgi:OmpA-OmpF porin, OOP family